MNETTPDVLRVGLGAESSEKRLRDASVTPSRERLMLTRLVTQLPEVVLSGSEVIALRRPIVYAWIRGGSVLYVGMSTNGLARPLTGGHHKLQELDPDDRLLVWSFESSAEAAAMEDWMIQNLGPELNGKNRPIPPPPAGEGPGFCARCGAELPSTPSKGSPRRFCSRRCRTAAWRGRRAERSPEPTSRRR